MNMDDAQARQRAYYAKTADSYDAIHRDEGEVPFALFAGLLLQLNVTSVLDIGSGTGRALLVAKSINPNIQVVGVEPSKELRQRGYLKGLSERELIDGDAMKLGFPNQSFDLVFEHAALHHIPRPHLAVAEMLRVARRAILISDSNAFGQGGKFVRAIKQAINAVGLWPLAYRIKTLGKGFDFSNEDGVSYSYSVFNDLPLLEKHCQVHLLGTHPNLYRSSPGVTLLAVKRN